MWLTGSLQARPKPVDVHVKLNKYLYKNTEDCKIVGLFLRR